MRVEADTTGEVGQLLMADSRSERMEGATVTLTGTGMAKDALDGPQARDTDSGAL